MLCKIRLIAADDLEGFDFAVAVILELDDRAESDFVYRDGIIIDDFRIVQGCLNFCDLGFHDRLFVFGFIVFRILGEVALRTGFLQLLCHFRTADGDQFF